MMAARDKNGVNVYPGDRVRVYGIDGLDDLYFVDDVEGDGVIIRGRPYFTYQTVNGIRLTKEEADEYLHKWPWGLMLNEEYPHLEVSASMVEVDLERSPEIDRTIPYGVTIEITSMRIEGRIIEE